MRMSRRLASYADLYPAEPISIIPTRWRRYGGGVDNDSHFHYQNNAVWVYITIPKKIRTLTVNLSFGAVPYSIGSYYRQSYEKIALYKADTQFDPLEGTKHSSAGSALNLGYGVKTASDTTVTFTADENGNRLSPGNYILYIWRYINNTNTNHYSGSISAEIAGM